MQRKRMKNTEFNIATWNVQSMLQAGKMDEIADELKKHKIKITAIQEVRWPQVRWIKNKNYSLLYKLRPESNETHFLWPSRVGERSLWA